MNAQFEGKLLLFRAVLPFLVGILAQRLFLSGGLFLSGVGDGVPKSNDGVLKSHDGGQQAWNSVSVILGCLAVWLAFWVSDFGSRGILLDFGQWSAWEAREPWMHWVWAGPLVLSLWLGAGAFLHRRGAFNGVGDPTFLSPAGIFRALSLAVLSWWMFPGGEGYADQIPRFRALGLLALVAWMLNTGGLGYRQKRIKSSWLAWGQVLQLGCVALVVLQSYASLGEWVVFGASMLAGALSVNALRSESGATGPLLQLLAFASVAGLCVSQAYAWNPIPIWLLMVLAFFPGAVAAVDGLVGTFSGERIWARFVAMAILVLVLLTLLYVFVVQAEPQW